MSGTGEPRRPVSSGSGAAPPRRPAGGPSGATGAASAAAAETGAPPAPPSRRQTVVGPPPEPAPEPSSGRSGRRADGGSGAGSEPDVRTGSTRTPRAPWWLRVVAWVVAVPLGLALVGIPARKAGYLSSQKLLDVVIGRDSGRYVPLIVIVLLWALVTAVLVQVIVEGGGWLLRRRRSRRGSASTPV